MLGRPHETTHGDCAGGCIRCVDGYLAHIHNPCQNPAATPSRSLDQTFDCTDAISTASTLAEVAPNPIAVDVMAITGGARGARPIRSNWEQAQATTSSGSPRSESRSRPWRFVGWPTPHRRYHRPWSHGSLRIWIEFRTVCFQIAGSWPIQMYVRSGSCSSLPLPPLPSATMKPAAS